MSAVLSPRIPLRAGATIPAIGLGTWPMGDEEASRVVADAITGGYRLVDTAENYENERGVGAGVRASGVPREAIFVTTKFNARWHGRERAAKALDASLDRLGLVRGPAARPLAQPLAGPLRRGLAGCARSARRGADPGGGGVELHADASAAVAGRDR